MELTDFLPQLCDPDCDRFNSPFESQGYWVATDAKIAVLIKCEDMPLLGYPHRDINIGVLLRGNNNMNLSFSAKELSEQLIPDMVDEYDRSGVKECEECKGEGDIECECCGHTYECDECGGSGMIGKAVLTGNKISDGDKLFRLFEDVYKYKYLNDIVIMSEIVGIDEVRCFNSSIGKPLVVSIGCVQMMIMGHMNPSELTVTAINLTTKKL